MPEGFSTTIPRAVCRLKKSLYGLKQASRQWYAKLTEVLYSRGYQHSSNDYSLFYKKIAKFNTFLEVYVDDILLTGDDEAEIISLKAHLDSIFRVKDLGEAHYFLRMEILPTKHGLILTQRKFVRELLAEFGDNNDTVVVCPLDSTHKLSANQGDLFDDPTLYRKIVGKLNFLTNTRPDLAFAVQHLSQFMQCPRQPHFQANLIWEFCLKMKLSLPRKPTVTQIGLHVPIPKGQSVVMLSSLATVLSHGNLRSKVQFPCHQLRLNIVA